MWIYFRGQKNETNFVEKYFHGVSKNQEIRQKLIHTKINRHKVITIFNHFKKWMKLVEPKNINLDHSLTLLLLFIYLTLF